MGALAIPVAQVLCFDHNDRMISWPALLLCLVAALGHQVQLATSQQAEAPPAAIPELPNLASLPDECGAVAQVLPGDSCQSIANWAGISVAHFQSLNPLMLCGTIALQPGSPVCTGNNDAFCAHLIIATQDDTCETIQQEGTIVNIDGLKAASCSDLAAADELPVCVNPDVLKCQHDTICGISISADLQGLLASQPDFCSILAECEASPELTTLEGKPSLTLTITSQTPEVVSATANGGHPALDSLAAAHAAGEPAVLRVTLTPRWFLDAGNSGQTRFEFFEAVGSGARKLMGNTYIPRTYGPTGYTRVPRYYYYG